MKTVERKDTKTYANSKVIVALYFGLEDLKTEQYQQDFLFFLFTPMD